MPEVSEFITPSIPRKRAKRFNDRFISTVLHELSPKLESIQKTIAKSLGNGIGGLEEQEAASVVLDHLIQARKIISKT